MKAFLRGATRVEASSALDVALAQALAHVSAEDMVDHYRKCGYAPLPLRDDVVAQLKIARSVAVWGALSLCALTINFE
jgi:hypothetical protein|eukprot:SAG25_NODE_2202_length_1843_cov_23.418641_1_plen_78_part_00